MFPAAVVLVLAGLGLFVAGLVTGTAVLFWSAAAAAVLAGVLLVLVGRRSAREADRDAAVGTGPVQPTGAAEPDVPRRMRPADRPPPPPPGRAAGPAPQAELHPPAGSSPPARPATAAPVPAEEDAEFTDLLAVMDSREEVLVVPGEPRYHLAGCPHVDGRPSEGRALADARTEGLTPCAVCRPVSSLAARSRRGPGRG